MYKFVPATYDISVVAYIVIIQVFNDVPIACVTLKIIEVFHIFPADQGGQNPVLFAGDQISCLFDLFDITEH